MYIVSWSNKEAEAYEDLLPDWIFDPEWAGGKIDHLMVSASQREWKLSCFARKAGASLYLEYPEVAPDKDKRFPGTLKVSVSDDGTPQPQALWKDPGGSYAPIAEIRDDGATALGLLWKFAPTKVRLQQSKFAARVRAHWGDACALTGITLTPLLEACHIKGFSDPMTTDDELVCGDNGILLAKHVHALFDNGLISFDVDGQVLWSSAVDNSTQTVLALPDRLDATKLTPGHQAHLKYHRAKNGFG